MNPNAVEEAERIVAVRAYHERTKHHLERYARSLGYLDWATQPNPFRRYDCAPLARLEIPPEESGPDYDALLSGELPAPRPLDAGSISRLFYYSLALSAWKQLRGPGGRVLDRWALRVNPSSGNLHPTEGYLVSGPLRGLGAPAAVWHYAPHEHGLERLRELDAGPPPQTVLVGLTSIHWREAWKYGERAFRYSELDLGHAIAAVAIAAAGLGWRTRLEDRISTRELSRLLGLDRHEGVEAEVPGCLLELTTGPWPEEATLSRPAEWPGSAWRGKPNRLSPAHHPWPVIDEVVAATENPGLSHPRIRFQPIRTGWPRRGLSAWRLIRQRRSAVAMDGLTRLEREAFFRMLESTLPAAAPVPFQTLPWAPCVSLALFVHRVAGLPPGLYLLVRHRPQETSLRRALRPEFLWRRPEGCPEELDLYLLRPGDMRRAARTVSCHQEIASDGVFAAAMLAAFDETLERGGAAMYPRMHWEAGMIGQVLYLEAEAAGVRATGIGCYFDDACHELLGITGETWQSLYHFTIGGAVEDPRLETADAYAHLRRDAA